MEKENIMERDNSLDEKRAIEYEKYVHLNGVEKYGRANHGEGSYSLLRELKISSLLDVGTANGSYPRFVRDNICEDVVGVDFAIKPRIDTSGITFLNAPAHQLPLWDNSFDILTSFDMLEHLVTEEVDEVLSEFKRVAKKYLLFTVSHQSSKFRRDTIGELHATKRPPEWWLAKFEKLEKVKKTKGKKWSDQAAVSKRIEDVLWLITL